MHISRAGTVEKAVRKVLKPIERTLYRIAHPLRSPSRSSTCRTSVLEAYQPQPWAKHEPTHCVVTNKLYPGDEVIAAHIVARDWLEAEASVHSCVSLSTLLTCSDMRSQAQPCACAAIMTHVPLWHAQDLGDDLDSARNVVPMYKPVEKRFDHMHFCIIAEGAGSDALKVQTARHPVCPCVSAGCSAFACCVIEHCSLTCCLPCGMCSSDQGAGPRDVAYWQDDVHQHKGERHHVGGS